MNSRVWKPETRSEQRFFYRYRVDPRAYAILKPHGIEQGQVIDISLGGISLCYYAHGWRVEDIDELDICLVDGGCRIRRIPCRSVSDIVLRDRTRSYAMVVRRRGLRFDRLDANKLRQLKKFIGEYTLNEVRIDDVAKSLP
ncbi:MAG: PilZ domain-containing protein [Deltaproteobacteria bacterium]|nr:PilZ domain-containing protein [Candidatus Anaeroferrophillacea bacterium]